MENRIAKVRQFLERPDDALVILRPENRRYLSGFTGSAGLVLITPEVAMMITDFRYVEQASEQSPGFQIVEHKGPVIKTLAEELKRLGVKRLAFEADFVNFSLYQTWSKELQVELLPTNGWVEKLRQIKDQAEIEQIRKSIQIADSAFAYILGVIKPGITEVEIAQELEFFMRRQGASGLAFDSIVASGPRAALPHAAPTDKAVATGELLKMDFGCVYQGYCSDITRTIGIGHLDDRQQEIYHLVLEAQVESIKAIKPGVSGQQVDQVARDILAKAGYGDQFGHSLGHSLGLVVHEGPRLAQSETTILEPGMLFTVEPGVYLPGWGGVRIEDVVVVTQEGCEILTKANKALTII